MGVSDDEVVGLIDEIVDLFAGNLRGVHTMELIVERGGLALGRFNFTQPPYVVWRQAFMLAATLPTSDRRPVLDLMRAARNEAAVDVAARIDALVVRVEKRLLDVGAELNAASTRSTEAHLLCDRDVHWGALSTMLDPAIVLSPAPKAAPAEVFFVIGGREEAAEYFVRRIKASAEDLSAVVLDIDAPLPTTPRNLTDILVAELHLSPSLSGLGSRGSGALASLLRTGHLVLASSAIFMDDDEAPQVLHRFYRDVLPEFAEALRATAPSAATNRLVVIQPLMWRSGILTRLFTNWFGPKKRASDAKKGLSRALGERFPLHDPGYLEPIAEVHVANLLRALGIGDAPTKATQLMARARTSRAIYESLEQLFAAEGLRS